MKHDNNPFLVDSAATVPRVPSACTRYFHILSWSRCENGYGQRQGGSDKRDNLGRFLAKINVALASTCGHRSIHYCVETVAPILLVLKLGAYRSRRTLLIISCVITNSEWELRESVTRRWRRFTSTPSPSQWDSCTASLTTTPTSGR